LKQRNGLGKFPLSYFWVCAKHVKTLIIVPSDVQSSLIFNSIHLININLKYLAILPLRTNNVRQFHDQYY